MKNKTLKTTSIILIFLLSFVTLYQFTLTDNELISKKEMDSTRSKIYSSNEGLSFVQFSSRSKRLRIEEKEVYFHASEIKNIYFKSSSLEKIKLNFSYHTPKYIELSVFLS